LSNERHTNEVTNPGTRSHDVELLVALILAEMLEEDKDVGPPGPGEGKPDPNGPASRED
jgi:hypothetical protein